jgi:hypothetical protein
MGWRFVLARGKEAIGVGSAPAKRLSLLHLRRREASPLDSKAQCHGEVVEGPCVAAGSKWLVVANTMAERYRGPDGPGLLEGSHNWERYLVKITPVDGRLTTWQGPDWAKRYFDHGQRPDLEKAL